MKIQFAQITATNCALAKTFKRNEFGGIESSAIAHMTEGEARIVAIDDVSQLLLVLAALTPHEAITCGIPLHGDTKLTTRAGAEFRQDAVARTNEAFAFPAGPALFPIDVDVDGDRYRSVDAVLDALEAASPWLQDVHRIARPSSSSFVADRGLRGVHVYFAVTRGTDIPALARRMQIEQWAAGLGHVKISKSGALLVRQLSDALVYQPSRLMFEADPVLHDVPRVVPLDQAFVERAPRVIRRGNAAFTADGLLDAGALPAVKQIDERRFTTHVKQARDARRREAKRVAIDYQKQNAIASGYDEQAGERYGLLATRALGDAKLPGAWEIAVKDIGRVRVAEILANIDSALGHQCADPFDTWRPDLDAKHFTKAEIVRMGDTCGVWSHKLQQFFEFTDDEAADLASPAQLAAEKLCGLIEYPEPVGKRSAPFVNVKHGLACLFEEMGVSVQTDICTGEIHMSDVPSKAELVDALSRIGCAGVTPATVELAIDTLAETNTVDPWRDAVLALPKWDRVPRLDTFFVDLCDALPSDALTIATQLLFSGIVRRQLEPGAPLPVIPVLIGGPGTGKTRFVEQIAAALKFPQPPAIVFNEIIRMTMEAATGAVAELAEMSGLGKRDVEEVKMWTTNTVDTYRAPYERRASAHKRRFALVGTANKHELNRDATGQRRLMPVYVNKPIDPAWTVEALQVFAEAKERFADKPDEYARIVRCGPDLVKAYNEADMRQGVGTPASDLDDLLPDVLRAIIRRTGERRVKSSEIRAVLDKTPSGRQIHARDYAQWLVTRGWEAGRTSDSRFYVAPEDFIDDPNKVVPLFDNNPFTTMERTA